MRFSHASELWRDYPELVPAVLAAEGVSADVTVASRLGEFTALADERLASRPESELPEIQAWRRTFARMGLKPTQYRSASEALLRRYRKEGALPRIHPLIDLCNAVSLAFAVPIAVFDVARIGEYLEVRYADGSEVYDSFSGDTEHPEPREVIFADGAGRAHARRWTSRQSAFSAVGHDTTSVLIVAEGMHDSADADLPRLAATLAKELDAAWSITAATAVLSRWSPRFEFGR
jgi:DNA/RNA-binding domain of Phe-tRNA-synthetase-like protein